MNGKTTAWVISLVAFSVAIAGATWWTIDHGKDKDPSWLFSHTANSGTLLKKSDGDYTLELTDIDPHVLAFTDRPARDSRVLAAADLVGAWPVLFADSPPNAVLVEHNPKSGANSVVLTLTNPKLVNETLSFDAIVITDEHPANLKRLTSGVHKTAPAQFANASLFIDDVSTTPTIDYVPVGPGLGQHIFCTPYPSGAPPC